MKILKYAFVILNIFSIIACSDDTTDISGVESTGLDLSSEITICSDQNEGRLSIIPDLGGVALCVNGSWFPLDAEAIKGEKDTILVSSDSMIYVVGSGDTLYADDVDRCFVFADTSNYHTVILDCGSFNIEVEHAAIRDSIVKEGTPLLDSRDNHSYKTVIIGNQTWMAENLEFDAEGSSCAWSSCEKYGHIYNFESALIACPQGSHLPSKEEYEKLIKYVDSHNGNYPISNDLASLDKVRYDYFSTDLFGFNAYRYKNAVGEFWTATETSEEKAYLFNPDKNSSWFYENEKSAEVGIRCLVD